MKAELEIDANDTFLLEMAGSAICDGDTTPFIERAIEDAIEALHFRGEADDERSATHLEALLKIGRREVEDIAGLVPRHVYREALEAIADLDGDSMSDAADAVDIARDALERGP